MKKVIAFLLSAACLLGLSGCGISQETVDGLNSEIAELGEQLSAAESDISALKGEKKALESEKAQLEDEKAALEGEKAELEDRLEQTAGELDELKNGPDMGLAAVKNAFDAGAWQEAIDLAAALHQKFNGFPQDEAAQQTALAAQKKLDDEAAAKKAEEERLAAEAAKTVRDRVRGLIRITTLSCSSPNSADGVGVTLYFTNKSPDKTIKYLNVTVQPYNAVGDSLSCDIRGYSRYTLEVTGPFAPGKGLSAADSWWWPNAWYNSRIKTIKLVGLTIEYADGSFESLNSDELQYVIW